jgi:chemotaxis protein MotB
MEMESAGMMRWLLTYADMITLLLATFIIMYALEAANKAQAFQEVAASFRAVFGLIPGGATVMPSEGTNQGINFKVMAGEPEQGGPGGEKSPKPVAGSGGDIEGKILAKLKKSLGAHKIMIRREARGLVVSLLTDKVLFDLGDVQLKKEIRDILADIASVLKQYPKHQIVVEGHTDDLAMQSTRIPSNWELSALRATAVVKYLVTEQGVDPSRLSAAGYGEYQPLVPNISESNRRMNRRVDIVIMKLD